MTDNDPTRSTDPRVNRGTFVGLTAGAAMGAAGMGSGIAQEEFGKPHPPIVPEDDPAIAVQHVEIRRPDIVMPAYYAQPRDARANTPGVVVVMHAWGVDQSIRDVVRRFAKAGFAAIAPDLFARYGAPSGDGTSDFAQFRPYVEKLMGAPAQADGDLRAAALWLKSAHPQGKVGVTGFCMGGAIAMRQTLTNDDVFAADAVWYGRVAGVDPTKVRMPIAGSYGERDTSIPAEEVRAFRKVLRAPNDIVIYPTSGHAFFDDQRASYVAPAAQDSWRRTIAFFTKYLKS
jgi:carboxymethylenebutenolidase